MDFMHSSETDVAYYILTLANKPIFYKDLIMEVIEKKCKPVQSLSAAIFGSIYAHQHGQPFSVHGRRYVGD